MLLSLVLPTVDRLWATVRLSHTQDWFASWLQDSVRSAGRGRSSGDAWCSPLHWMWRKDWRLSREDDHVHNFVAHVVKSFDTVDTRILYCLPGRLGLLGWFSSRLLFEFHENVRQRFKLVLEQLGRRHLEKGVPSA